MAAVTPVRRRQSATRGLPERARATYVFEQHEYKRADGDFDYLPPAIRIERPQVWQISANCVWVIVVRNRVITGLRPVSPLTFYGDLLNPATGKKSLLFAQFERPPDHSPNRVLCVVFPDFYDKRRNQISALSKIAFRDV